MLECSASEQTPQDYIVKIIYRKGSSHTIRVCPFLSTTAFTCMDEEKQEFLGMW